jgi:hypothetical protein
MVLKKSQMRTSDLISGNHIPKQAEGNDFQNYVIQPQYANDPFVKTAAGLKAGYDRAALGLADLFGAATPEMKAEQKYREKAAEAAGTLGSVGKFIGGTIPYVGSGIGTGALIAAATTPGDLKERALSGGSALAGGAIGAGLGRTIAGFKPSESAKTLMEKGIQPTLGQGIETTGKSALQNIIGQGIQKAEEASSSMPFLGAITRSARERGKNELAKTVIAKAEIPGVSAEGQLGNRALEKLGSGLSKSYDEVLKGIEVPKTHELNADLIKAVANIDVPADDKARMEVMKFISRQLEAADTGGETFTGQRFHQVISNLRKAGEQFSKSPMSLESSKGKLLKDAATTLDSYLVDSASSPEMASRLKELRKAYHAYMVMGKAAESVAAPGGRWTPAMLHNAVKATSSGPNKGNWRKGLAFLQDLSGPGKEVLTDTLGESGTTPRQLLANLAKGGVEGAAAYSNLPQYSLLAAAMGLGSIRPVQKALLGGYRGQKEIAEAATELARLIGQGESANK